MGIRNSRFALLAILGIVVAILAAIAWDTSTTSSQPTDGDKLENCPQAGKWAISVWNGADGTATDQALATCEGVAVDVGYWLNPDTQQWLRYFPSKPEVSNLPTLDSMQAIIARGAPGSGPSAGQSGAPLAVAGVATQAEAQSQVVNCPQPGKWAISVWSGEDGRPSEEALATCSGADVAAVYWLNPDTQGWLRYFSGRPEIATLTTVDNMQGFIALGATATPTPTPPSGIIPTAGASFSGTTSQDEEITFEICDDGTCINEMLVRADVQCTSDGTESWRRHIYSTIPIENSAFNLELKETTFSGQFTSPTAATGNLQFYSEEYRSDEGGWVTCDSGPLTWSATAN